MNSEGLLVDTDVSSYVAWQRPKGKAFIPILRDRLLAVSFATVGELYFGAVKAGWGDQKIRSLETILKRYTVIPGTYAVARAYGDIKAAFREQVDECDMWIAATALVHQLPVVTNNLRHFEPMRDRFAFGLLHPERTLPANTMCPSKSGHWAAASGGSKYNTPIGRPCRRGV
ncbi:MAG: PIN domain-containing protein [bacterium]|nr:PIN domain-containing protein [bacterium]